MALRIEDYAIIGNRSTAALVGRDGSIDWLGMPRFDSDAFFAALLGTPDHGRWQLCPAAPAMRSTRRYVEGTLVLETEFETDDGSVLLTDCMNAESGGEIIRLVRGLRGAVTMTMDLAIRYGYGAIVPWVTRSDEGRFTAIAGAERLTLDTQVALEGEAMRTAARFTVEEGQVVPFVLTWTRSYEPMPEQVDAVAETARIVAAWQEWSAGFKADGCGRWAPLVLRSLITLKALTHHATGGIAAAATTSLPEQIGGNRNWDYRFCWLRDATLTLYALEASGFTREAEDWCAWLRRAIAGAPAQMQIMYGMAGERRLTEYEVPWLPGYESSSPVRIGNAASGQVQLDVYGEVLDVLYQARKMKLSFDEWDLEMALLQHLEEIWMLPDAGLWEIRGANRHFTHSKVMVWVSFDRAVRNVEEFGLEGPVERWSALRDQVHAEICSKGFDPALNSFVQSYGASELDASLLLLPATGFLPPEDPRIVGTVAAVEQRLLKDGFVKRYDTASAVDGLAGDEGAFLACSFWLVDAYAMQGRGDDATALFERLIGLCNDVGLLAEEYDPRTGRQVGNFPQAFSHVALVNAAHNLTAIRSPSRMRAGEPATLTTVAGSIQRFLGLTADR